MHHSRLPISALQHWLYCPRQCALIHLEQCWVESLSTALGRLEHQAVDVKHRDTRRGIKAAFGLELVCERLGLTGKADVVEFHREDGQLVPFPVEHKHGAAKTQDWDRVQLCAQALCLEEMLQVPVPQGALFYARTRRREEVAFTPALRQATEAAVRDTAAMLAAGRTPPAVWGKRCKACSLQERCLPQLSGTRAEMGRLQDYLAQAAYLEGELE
ncbi:CRISPR-associated protein Cas4 [Megalodesulfovibrio paquesii]